MLPLVELLIVAVELVLIVSLNVNLCSLILATIKAVHFPLLPPLCNSILRFARIVSFSPLQKRDDIAEVPFLKSVLAIDDEKSFVRQISTNDLVNSCLKQVVGRPGTAIFIIFAKAKHDGRVTSILNELQIKNCNDFLSRGVGSG